LFRYREIPTMTNPIFINMPSNLLHQSYMLHCIAYLVGAGKIVIHLIT
jgi:hypothetical protein